ncbi:MAG: hypothetical protein NC911_01325 [Candidatus Omnitrophica bacterium]|nr:hypothetical protein [Candidatus Omnitrophota bacterium]
MKKLWPALGILISLLNLEVLGTDSSDRILWQENFSRFPAGFRPGCYHDGKGEVLVENGKHFYRFPGGFMLGSGWNYYGASHWKNYVLRFQLRFTSKASLYLVVKRGGWREKFNYLWYYVTITPAQVSVNAHNLTDTKEDLPPRKIEPVLETGRWYDFEIKVTARNIQVCVLDGKEKRILWNQEVLAGGGGIDFHGSVGFDLTNIEVEELESK